MAGPPGQTTALKTSPISHKQNRDAIAWHPGDNSVMLCAYSTGRKFRKALMPRLEITVPTSTQITMRILK